MKNLIGLEQEKVKTLAEKLNYLLANYQVFYQNLRGFHWNIKGKDFFELHVKFEEYYNIAILKIDEIAERVLTLEETPLHAYSDYLGNTGIEESKNISNGTNAVEVIIKNLSHIISIEREILALAGDAKDEGTVTLMSDYISETEKTLWMLNSYLK